MAVIANDLEEQRSTARWHALLARVRAHLNELAAHPSRSVVLLPYAQLKPLAARLWAVQFPDSFVPRFETTYDWAAQVGWFEPTPTDLTFDYGRDLLTAASLLTAAGLQAQQNQLAAVLLQQAYQLAEVVASVPSAVRSAWAERSRTVLPPDDGPMRLEAAVGRIAIAWASTSEYVTDVLFSERVGHALDAVLVVPGQRHDLLTQSLVEHYHEKAVKLSWPELEHSANIVVHSCADGEDEAERSAACVLAHLTAGRVPVGLVAIDRLLTRRISALLTARGIPLRDETGWKLSTTHAAAQVLALLKAAVPDASANEVLDALKLLVDVNDPALQALERRLRAQAVRTWNEVVEWTHCQRWIEHVQKVRQHLRASRKLSEWISTLQETLSAFKQGARFATDPAGRAVIDALKGVHDWHSGSAVPQRMSLSEFTHWARETLEASIFRPRPPRQGDAPVVVLPVSQLLGRLLGALVFPGADEQRLPAVPEASGPWTEAQRQALHLPVFAQRQIEQAHAWRVAMSAPQVDVLWRRSDDNGEPLLPSPLIQVLELEGPLQAGAETRAPRRVKVHTQPPPAPSGAELPVATLSASSYDMLRACPYRFFALRQLGLSAEAELDEEVGKADFGTWVHNVLQLFHEALQRQPKADRVALMDQAAEQAVREQHIAEDTFLPFSVIWPRWRDSYLVWLQDYEATLGGRFEQAEVQLSRPLDNVLLRGFLDRIDRLKGGSAVVIDYKTESAARTKERIKPGSEDIQLAFYALLMNRCDVCAMYVNVNERDPAQHYEASNVKQMAKLLQKGIEHDMARIAAGEPMPALGEGNVCNWCEARGLCRKDFWDVQ